MNKLKSLCLTLKNNIFILEIAWNISKFRFLIKIITTIISAILPIINILLVKYVIEIMESGNTYNIPIFKKTVIILLSFATIKMVLQIFEVWNATYIDPIIVSKINNHMNKVFINKARDFEYSCFEKPEFFDKYVRALNQVDSIVHIVFNSFFGLCSNIISIATLSVVIFSMDWIVIIFVLFNVTVQFIQSIISAKINFEASQTLTPFTRKQNYIKRLLYIPDYAKEIKFYDIISTGKKYYEEALTNIVKILKKYGVKVAIIITVINVLTVISSSGLMILLISRVLIGIYKIADFTALNNSATQLENTLKGFFQTVTNFYQNSLEINNLKYIYNYRGENINEKGAVLDASEAFQIVVKHVSFKYPNSERFVLQDISFSIEKGEKISVVGLNGSGKTTLIKLILGLYKPTSGDIYINNKNICEYNKDALRKKIGITFQDSHTYAYSIKENIAFESDISSEAITSLKKLDIYETIESLPKKFETLLSKEFNEDGINLSGGELQKICIARTFNSNKGLYIFDEPSSSLDPISEFKINKIITELSNKSVILISHRLLSTTLADKILMLENGRISEIGNHSELMNLNGSYAKLFNLQASYYIHN